MSKENAAQRLRLWIVFLIGFSIIGLEVASFQALSFVNDYLTATRVIAIALLGIAAGGLFSYPAHRWSPNRSLRWALKCLPLTFLATFYVIARLNAYPFTMMALMTLPYATASFCLSLFFGQLRASLIYWYDLAGASVGALAITMLVPPLREEGSLLFLATCSSVPLLLHARAERRENSAGVTSSASGLCLVAVCTALLIAHVTVDPFNLMRVAKVDPELFPRKMFDHVQTTDESKRYELLYSKGSLIERIDITKRPRKGWASVYNGQLVDYIDSARAREGWLDNRLPTLLRLGENPDTLLVGPSGQGLCKAVQALGKGHTDAVEINGAIADVMTREMYERSGRAYEGMELTIGDVRTFLRRTDRKYDFITLLNTHRIWSMGHQGPPEYVHTVEAMSDYFAHLKDRGFVLFEERNINERADLGIRRIVHTAKKVLRDLGVREPAKHFAIWELYHNCTKAGVEAQPPRCNRDNLFTFVMIKRTPIDDAEFAHFGEWAQKLGARPDKGMGYRGIVWRYLPQAPTQHYWTQVVERDDPYDTPGIVREKHIVDAVYDDRPFPYEVFREKGRAHEILSETAWLALLMVLLPSLVVFIARERKSANSGSGMVASALVPFFALLGVAYLVLEIVLVQKFGIFLSSPAYSFAIVLGTMLVASGLGGFHSYRASRSICLTAASSVVAYAVFMAYGLDPLLAACMALPFPVRILVTVLLVAPGAYAMGFPFPYAMDLAKRQLSDRHAGLFFGINGAAGAVATPLTLIWSMEHGFRMTALLGGAAYLGCGLLLAIALLKDKASLPLVQPAQSA